jgi:hypothetical protein
MTSILFPTFDNIDQIRSLNDKYLISHLTDVQKQSGFIRIEYDRDDLKQIITHKEIVIATINDKVIGYYLIGRKSGKAALKYQKNKAISFTADETSFDNIGYGCQVCIDEAFRNNGLFGEMLIALTNEVKDKYSHWDWKMNKVLVITQMQLVL